MRGILITLICNLHCAKSKDFSRFSFLKSSSIHLLNILLIPVFPKTLKNPDTWQ